MSLQDLVLYVLQGFDQVLVNLSDIMMSLPPNTGAAKFVVSMRKTSTAKRTSVSWRDGMRGEH